MNITELTGETVEPILELAARKKKAIQRAKQLKQEYKEILTEVEFYEIQIKKAVQVELNLDSSSNFIIDTDVEAKKVRVHQGEMTLQDAIDLKILPESMLSNLSPESRSLIENLMKRMQNPGEFNDFGS